MRERRRKVRVVVFNDRWEDDDLRVFWYWGAWVGVNSLVGVILVGSL